VYQKLSDSSLVRQRHCREPEEEASLLLSTTSPDYKQTEQKTVKYRKGVGQLQGESWADSGTVGQLHGSVEQVQGEC